MLQSKGARPEGGLRRSRARRALLLAALQLVTSVVFLGPFLFGSRLRGFPLDDAWIHQVVARTFAETGTLGYLPGAYGAGATSYLWAALLALGQKVHAEPVVFTTILGLAGALGTGQALLAILADERGRADEDFVAIALACAGGDLTWFAVSGMEASFVAAAALGAIALATSKSLAEAAEESVARRASLLAGVLAGVAALTRPDFVPLGLVIAGVVFLRRRRAAEAAIALAPWALACVLYFGSNALLAGTPMPATMRGRRWLWIDSVLGKTSAASLAVDFVFAWAYRLRQFTLGLESNLAFWIASGFALAGLAASAWRRRLGLLLAAGFALFHAAVFVAVLPVPGHGGRYQPLVPVLFVLFAVLGTFELARALGDRIGKPAPLRIGATALWLVCLGNAFWEWHLAHRDAVEHVRRTEVAAGLAIAELPADAVVASFDVGGIGYFSKRKLLDLGALTTPKVMEALDHDDVVDLLRREHVTHLVLPAGEDADYPDLSNFGFRLRVVDHPEVALETLADFTSDHDTWLRGVWYVQNATFRQRLSRVTYQSCSGPGTMPAVSGEGIGDGVVAKDRTRYARAYAAAAQRGVCVRIGASEAGDDCFHVAIGMGTETPAPGFRTSAVVTVANVPARAPVDPERVKRELAKWTGPYAATGDASGAVGAALHGIVSAVRAERPCFWTPLPAIEKALPPGFTPPPEPRDTAGWGVLVTALVAAAVVLAARAQAPREAA